MRTPDWNRPERLSVAYLLAPALGMLLTLPIPLLTEKVFAMLAIPVYVGLLSAPGYIYAWSDPWKRGTLSHGMELWARWSLRTSLAASVAGAALAGVGLLVHVVAFALVSAVLSFTLLRRLRAKPGRRVVPDSGS
jgi:hypothetical protein